MTTRGRTRSHDPSTSRPRSLSRPRSSSSSRSPSSRHRSGSRSGSHHRHQRREHHEHHQPHHNVDHRHGLFNNPATLLAGIGLAAIAAHKVWPKGVIHGAPDDWEAAHSKHGQSGHSSESRSHSHSHGHGHGHGHQHEHRRHSRERSSSHHHHDRREHHEHHSHHHRHGNSRRNSDVEHMLLRSQSSRGRGDVIYYEEVAPVRRPPTRASSIGERIVEPRRSQTIGTAERALPLREPRGPPKRLPYPDAPYPGDMYYEPPRRRAPVVVVPAAR